MTYLLITIKILNYSDLKILIESGDVTVVKTSLSFPRSLRDSSETVVRRSKDSGGSQKRWLSSPHTPMIVDM